MTITVLELWNLASFAASLVVFVFAYRLYVTLRGGPISHAYSLILTAIGVLSATFFISLLFNLAGISPVTSYGISIRDIGVLAAVIMIGYALRSSHLFWISFKTTLKD